MFVSSMLRTWIFLFLFFSTKNLLNSLQLNLQTIFIFVRAPSFQQSLLRPKAVIILFSYAKSPRSTAAHIPNNEILAEDFDIFIKGLI